MDNTCRPLSRPESGPASRSKPCPSPFPASKSRAGSRVRWRSPHSARTPASHSDPASDCRGCPAIAISAARRQSERLGCRRCRSQARATRASERPVSSPTFFSAETIRSVRSPVRRNCLIGPVEYRPSAASFEWYLPLSNPPLLRLAEYGDSFGHNQMWGGSLTRVLGWNTDEMSQPVAGARAGRRNRLPHHNDPNIETPVTG
jgi:hypothetical protein